MVRLSDTQYKTDKRLMFDESFVTRFLWNTNTEKMIKATEMICKMSHKYDIPVDYKHLGIYEDDKQDEDSPWGIS